MKKAIYQEDGLWFRDHESSFARPDTALPLFHGPVSAPAGTLLAAAPPTPSPRDEISFLNGLNKDGTLTDNSYWGSTDRTAYKWGDSTAGTGATISYSFKDNLNATEQQTVREAMAMWSSVADVHWVQADSNKDADVVIGQGNRFLGSYTTVPSSNGEGSTLGEVTGQADIRIATSVLGFELTGSFDTVGGYGIATIVHELGHLLGLGHAGAYNGDVDPATQQQSAYDERMYTTMSYIGYYNTDAKYYDQNPNPGTDWGVTDDGYLRQAPHTVMGLDILAIQQLYGASKDTPLDGGTTYGFNCNIQGDIHDFFDFTVNTDPVVTLYNQGTGNTLDLSGYSMGNTVDLHDGTFSSVAGHTNNLAIALGTRIETAIGGTAGDTITANDLGCDLIGKGGKDALFGGSGDDVFDGGGSKDVLFGYGGQDTLTGGAGVDTYSFTSASDSSADRSKADVITDFSHADGEKIDLSGIDAISGGANNAFRFIGSDAFSGLAGELRFEVVKGDSFVSGDIDGNGVADFTIKVDDVTSLVAADFVL